MFSHFAHLLRTLRHHPAYSALNVLGLALALACSLLLYWLVRFHESFDTYHPQAARIYRLVTQVDQGILINQPGIPTPVGPALRHDFPGLGTVAMSIGQEDQQVQVLEPGGRLGAKYPEPYAVAFVESEYFSIFAYRWLVGTAAQALRAPRSVVLTQRLARQYFGAANPLGRRLRLNGRVELTVTGLLADIPDNTDQRYGFFISYPTLRQYQHSGTTLETWEGVSSQTHGWVRLAPGATPAQLARALLALHRAHHPRTLRTYHYRVLPLLAQHFAMEYDGTIARRTLLILSGIGGLLLLTAGVNFVNLATAQALGRGREIGVRRTVGATSRRIFWQFMAETLLLVLLAAGTGLVLAYATLPGLREWTNTPIPYWLDAPAGLFMAGVILLLTLGAGWYPGQVLAGFRPAQVLKGQTPGQASGGQWVRRGLVVAQLALSQGFILAVLVMYQQLSVWLTTSPGFATAGRVVVPTPWLAGADQAHLRADLRRVPGVAGVSFSFDSPAVGTTNTSYFAYDHRAPRENFDLVRLSIDDQYLPLFDLKLVAGQPLPTGNWSGYLLNETAVRLLGVGPPAAVIGHQLGLENDSEYPADYGPIVGVVRDWRYQGFETAAIPMVLFHNPGEYHAITVRLAPGAALPPAVRTVWERYFPQHLFASFGLEERVASFYEHEREQLAIVRLAALTAIAIGCLGLYGLVAFIAQRRAREIGIRKVFGARPWQVMVSFGGEFVGLLAVAFAVAAPLAGWLMQRWLGQFATHISLQPWLFGVGLAGTAALTLLTIGYHSLRAALVPPAAALRAR